MVRANPINPNTRTYWNGVYGTPAKRDGYLHDETGFTKRFSRALEEVKDGDKVLDLGCGVGVFTSLVKSTYPQCEVWGVDISSVAIAANQIEHNDITYKQGYIGYIDDVPEEYFDVVFSGETLEHLDEPMMLFTDAVRFLKPGGKLVITTPKEDSIRSPEHTWYFSQDDIEQLFVKSGFKEVKFVYLPDMEHLMVIFAIGIMP